MKFYDLTVEIQDGDVVLSQTVVDGDGDSRYYDVTISPEQAIIVSREIKSLACKILGEDDE